MSAHRHIADRAAEIAALAPDEPERVAAFDHARACDACARALAEAQALLACLDAVPPPSSPSTELLERVKRNIAADDAAERRGRQLSSALVLASGFLLTAIAKHRATDLRAWLFALAALSVAVVTTLIATAGARGRTLLLFASSLLLATMASGSGDFAARIGTKCLLIELFAAALPFAAAARAARLRRVPAEPTFLAAAAAAGALAGQASLHLTCPEAAAAAHLLVFHFGGVLLAFLFGLLGARWLPRPPTV